MQVLSPSLIGTALYIPLLEPRFSNNYGTPSDGTLRRTPDIHVAKSEELAMPEKFRMHQDNCTGLPEQLSAWTSGPTSPKNP